MKFCSGSIILLTLLSISSEILCASESLTLDTVEGMFGDTLFVVCDFPKENNREVFSSLKNYWLKKKESNNIRETILISAYDDDFGATKENLKDKNFYLYGTFALTDENLVFESLRDTPYDFIEKEASQFGDTKVGVLSVGRNPFGSGYVLIVAAPSPDSLLDCYSNYDGAYSFIGFVDDKVLMRKVNDHDFYPNIDKLPLEKVIEDIDFFFLKLETVHPHLLAYVSPEEYLKRKKMVRVHFQQIAAREGYVSIDSMAVILAETAAMFRDGHTYIELDSSLIDVRNNSRRLLPFHLKYSHENFFIGSTFGILKYLHGYKVVKINDENCVDFLRPILSSISGEKESYRVCKFIDRQRTYQALIPLTDNSTISITTQNDKGATTVQSIDLVSVNEYDTNIPSEEQPHSESYHRFYHNEKTCYYQYNSFIESDEEKMAIDSLFSQLYEKKAVNLIIDLRYNGGGNSSIGNFILSYLTSEPYYMWSRSDIRLTKELFEKYPYYEKKYGELEGMTMTNWVHNNPIQPENKSNKFTGNLFVLTGSRTFSSAVSFASVIKDFKIGTLIGEETSNTRKHYGDPAHLSLPNSSIGFAVSCKTWYPPKPQPGDENCGVIPDIITNPKILEKFNAYDDPVLAYTLDLLKK